MRGLTCLIIDDEADQASLNTRERRADGTRSAINDKISELRAFFDKNTYLQVTATPQSLFLQTAAHSFRPKFTVLSHPGHDYVGGDDFFAVGSNLIKEFDLNDIATLAPGAQPAPRLELPVTDGGAGYLYDRGHLTSGEKMPIKTAPSCVMSVPRRVIISTSSIC